MAVEAVAGMLGEEDEVCVCSFNVTRSRVEPFLCSFVKENEDAKLVLLQKSIVGLYSKPVDSNPVARYSGGGEIELS